MRRVEFSWPSEGISVTAHLLDKDEPEVCDLMWNNLAEPIKLFCRHTISTGEYYMAEGRPPRHPIPAGTIYGAFGRKQTMQTRIKPGSICYSRFGGYGGFHFIYGKVTEPAPAWGPVVAEVDNEFEKDFVRAGKAVWQAQYRTHEPMIMMAKRGV